MRSVAVITADIAAKELVRQLQQTKLVGLGTFRDKLGVTHDLNATLMGELDRIIDNPAAQAHERDAAQARRNVAVAEAALNAQERAANEVRVVDTADDIAATGHAIAILQAELAQAV